MIAISDKQGYFEIVTPQFFTNHTLFRKLLKKKKQTMENHRFVAGKTQTINNGHVQ